MKYKALVIDLDGTLVGRDGVISDANVASLREAVSAGVRVCVSTGRMPRGCARLLAPLGIGGMHIFYDGALVCDIACRKVLYREPLERDTALELVRLGRERKAYLELYTDDQYFAEAQDSRAEAHARLLGFPPSYSDLEELTLNTSVVKGEMVMLSHHQADREALAAFKEHFEDRLRFSVATSPVVPGVEFVNIVSPRVSKGEALRRLAEAWHLGLESVAAIGDGDNDLPVLRSAGLAIAMGNATAEVKVAAQYITEAVDRDGVAWAIRRWILTR